MFLCFTALFVCIRFRSTIRVVRASIVNANNYKELDTSSLNLSYLATFYLSIPDYFKLWKHTREHKQLHHYVYPTQVSRNHLKFKYDIQDKLLKHNKRTLMYCLNMIDFTECYSGSVLANVNERTERYKSWHFMYPLDRASSTELQLLLFGAGLGTLMIIFSVTTVSLAVLYHGLSHEFPHDYWPTFMELIEVLPKSWSNPSNVLRILELYGLLYFQVPQLYDAAQVALDVLIITSRANRLIEVLSHDLRMYSDQTDYYINYEKSLRPEKYFSSIYNSIQQIDESQEGIMHDLNRRIRANVNLVRLLYLEFLTTKRSQSSYLNISVCINGICMSYAVTLLLTQDKTRLEYYMIAVSFLSLLMPTVMNLIFCARMEKSVSFMFLQIEL